MASFSQPTHAVSLRRPPGWDFYWPVNEYTPDDRRATLIRELIAFFSSSVGAPFLSSAHTRFSRIVLHIDYTALISTPGITSDLQDAMYHAPTEALACLGAAACTTLFASNNSNSSTNTISSTKKIEAPAKVLVRLSNHPHSFLPISSIRADQVGRLVTIRGTVARATPVRCLVTSISFLCAKCGASKEVVFPDGRYQPPVSCGTDGCRSRTMMPLRPQATCIDWQRVQLQGLPRDERGGEGRVPRPMDVELLEDLVEGAAPGETVTVTGIVKVLQGDASSGKRSFGGSGGSGGSGGGGGASKKQCLFLPFVEAISVVRGSAPSPAAPYPAAAPCVTTAGPGGHPHASNEAFVAVIEENDGELNYLPPNMPGFTQLDLDFIREFTKSCEGDQLRQLVLSLAPGICGMEVEKAGLLLALFGGVRIRGTLDHSPIVTTGNKTAAASSSGGRNKANSIHNTKTLPVRGDIHVLLVGDPGLGKSQLLQAAAAVSPRGVYVCGSSTSAAGLTVSVVKDNGEYCFDAGALVLADRGVCCVDEFDKASAEHAALLGAMEQQEVAVAKAGLVASLPARTTLLAAANPAEGQYNRGKTLMQNLRMSPAMLSRFDLVFLLLDRPDAEKDQLLTEHVMAAHSGIEQRALAARQGLLQYHHQNQEHLAITNGTSGGTINAYANGHGAGSKERLTLRERLRQRRPDDEPLPPQLLRKYIAYARQYVHPTLTPEAATVIKSFFLTMRAQSASNPTSLAITHRQLESVVRLAEARARVDLRERVTVEDAEEAIDVMKESLAGTLCGGGADGELGVLDFVHPTAGGGGGGGQFNISIGSKKGFQAERRRFLEALRRLCESVGRTEVEAHELYGIADRIELATPDTGGFFEQLNETGDLLKRGGGKFVYNGGGVRLGLNTQGTGRENTSANVGVAQPRKRPATVPDDPGEEFDW